jgi:hypothetical protein
LFFHTCEKVNISVSHVVFGEQRSEETQEEPIPVIIKPVYIFGWSISAFCGVAKGEV